MAMHFLGRCDLTSETILQLHATCQYDRYNVPALVRKFDLYAFPSWLEHAWTRQTVEAELRAGRPVILGLDCSRVGHFVLAVGYTDDGKVIIHDPYWKESGWPFGGPFVTTDWPTLMWRNGIILHTDPFTSGPRTVSGSLVATTSPRTLLPGQDGIAEFAIKNNGQDPWPAELYLAAVDAYSTSPQERASPFAVLADDPNATSGTWISRSRVAKTDHQVAPGDVAYFRVPLHAPNVTEPTSYRENFNLLDGDGHWFSEDWRTGPSNRQVFFRTAVVPQVPGADKLPLIETAAGGRPALPWRFKNAKDVAITVAMNAPSRDATSVKADETTETATETSADEPTSRRRFVATTITTSPALAADAQALKLSLTPGHNFETAFVGDPLARDYHVEAWVYCDYRPAEKDRGYDRYGIFMRDSGQHRIAPKTELENGDCVVMCYDSDNGRLRCGNFETGGIMDFRTRQSTYIKGSGWHKFGIRGEGTTITFELDGASIHVVRNAPRYAEEAPRAFTSGDCGVFYRSLFPNESDRKGMYFAGFRVDP